MKKSNLASFDDVLGAASSFPVEVMEELSEILHKRAIEIRRKEMGREVKNARSEFKAGKTKKVSADDLMRELAS